MFTELANSFENFDLNRRLQSSVSLKFALSKKSISESMLAKVP